MKNFSFKKLASKLQPIVIRALNTHMKTNLNAMNDNLDIGQDINENNFEPLKATTLNNRAKKGQGTKILEISGNMRKTKLFQATVSKPVVRLKAIGKSKGKKKIIYGASHNVGFTTKKGARVPKREWFGFAKGMKPGGAEYKKMVNTFFLEITRAWKI